MVMAMVMATATATATVILPGMVMMVATVMVMAHFRRRRPLTIIRDASRDKTTEGAELIKRSPHLPEHL
jgi:hypothetical protein